MKNCPIGGHGRRQAVPRIVSKAAPMAHLHFYSRTDSAAFVILQLFPCGRPFVLPVTTTARKKLKFF